MAINIMVPEMGESVVDARVARWLKHAGDVVTVGEPLVELETDKVDVEVTASKSGTLASIAHPDGSDVKIGDVLGTIEEASGAWGPGVPGSAAPVGVPESATPVEVLRSRGPEVIPTPSEPQLSRAATPSARREARERDVPLAAVQADGPRVTRDDVRKTPGPQDSGTPGPQSTPGPQDPGTPIWVSTSTSPFARRFARTATSTAACLMTTSRADTSRPLKRRSGERLVARPTRSFSAGERPRCWRLKRSLASSAHAERHSISPPTPKLRSRPIQKPPRLNVSRRFVMPASIASASAFNLLMTMS